jgi:hypothetical protein
VDPSCDEAPFFAQSKTREVGDEMRVRIRTRVWG